MSNNLTVSIIIRALNEEAHIGKLLYGIQQQTKLPDQIILVDSGSTDNTLLVASSYDVIIEKITKCILAKKSSRDFSKKTNITMVLNVFFLRRWDRTKNISVRFLKILKICLKSLRIVTNT